MCGACLTDKTPGKTGDNSETNKHGEKNSPKMPVLNEYGIIGCEFFLPPQEDDVNTTHDIILGKIG